MILSTNDKLGEYGLIRRPEHVARVWEVVEAALPKYWVKFVEAGRAVDPTAELVAKYGRPGSRPAVEKEAATLGRVFEKAVSAYEKEAEKYRNFFDPAALEEYQDDPNAFKQVLSRDVPVIARTLRQQRPELKEWQAHFRMSRANDLLQVFCNVLDFRGEWSDSHPAGEYAGLDEAAAFGLDPLDSDEAMSVKNVIGMGIKSIVLHHLDPRRLPPRGRNGLYALYFLSGKHHFDLPSKSSEFLMVNDVNPAPGGSIIMDQNFWYPYGLFSLYALRTFRWMDRQASGAGYTLDPSVRYVYVERFFQAVCDQHTEDLKTMRAHDRFEVPA